MPSRTANHNPGDHSAIAIVLQSIGLLSALIFLIGSVYEVLVINKLHTAQHFLIALLLLILSVWAFLEAAVFARRETMRPLKALRGVLAVQIIVIAMRHWDDFQPSPTAGSGIKPPPASPEFGQAILFLPVYLALFLAINQCLIQAFAHAERMRANQLQEQMAILKKTKAELQEARDAAEQANLALLSANAVLHGQATTDMLTGVLNRNHFQDVLKAQAETSQSSGESLSLLIIDIDNFKSINDNHGHSLGDQILVEVTRLLTECQRHSDQLARWGGDEFIMMLPRTKGLEALEVARRLCASSSAHRFPAGQRVTLSIGVAELEPNESLQQWFDRADAALYAVKKTGRNNAAIISS